MTPIRSLLVLAVIVPVATAPLHAQEIGIGNASAVPGPPPPLPDLSDPNSRSAESLAEPGIASPIPKALRSSATKAGGPANELNSGGRNEPTAPPSNLVEVLAGRELFYGNYCGRGQRGKGLAPIDELDAACMRHDACYDAAGYASCACDRTLAQEAAIVADQPGVALDARRKALSVVEAAGVMQCRGP